MKSASPSKSGKKKSKKCSSSSGKKTKTSLFARRSKKAGGLGALAPPFLKRKSSPSDEVTVLGDASGTVSISMRSVLPKEDSAVTAKKAAKHIRLPNGVMNATPKEVVEMCVDRTSAECRRVSHLLSSEIPRVEREIAVYSDKVSVQLAERFDAIGRMLEDRKLQLLASVRRSSDEKKKLLVEDSVRLQKYSKSLEKLKDDLYLVSESLSSPTGDSSELATDSEKQVVEAVCRMADTLSADCDTYRSVATDSKQLRVNECMFLNNCDDSYLTSLVACMCHVDSCMKPSAPSLVELRLMAPTSIGVKWTHAAAEECKSATDSGAHQSEESAAVPVTGFQVHYCHKTVSTKKHWKTLALSRAEAENHTQESEHFWMAIDGLDFDEDYIVRVRAVNASGTSLASGMAEIRTECIPPPLAPVLTATIEDQINAELKWTVSERKVEEIIARGTSLESVTDVGSVADASGDCGKRAVGTVLHAVSAKDVERWRALVRVTHFHVQFRKAKKKSWRSRILGVSGAEHLTATGGEHRLEHLTPGSSYRFRVRARNSVDWSPWSRPAAVAVAALGPEKVRMRVAEFRGCQSESFHPSNLLLETDAPYASMPPTDFESSEADWVVFATDIYYSTLTRLTVEQYQDPCDVRSLALEVCTDLSAEDWVTVQPSPISLRKLSDRQVFELRPLGSVFKFVRVSFLENFDAPIDAKRKFMLRNIWLYGIPAG